MVEWASNPSFISSFHSTNREENFVQEGLLGCLVAKSCPTLLWSWTIACQAPLSMEFPGKNTGVGCHFLLQGIFPTQGSNPHLHRRWLFYHWVTWEGPRKAKPNFTHSTILKYAFFICSVSSVTQLCPNSLRPHGLQHVGLPVHHQSPEFIQTHVHWVSDALQPSHPLASPSPPAFNLSQHQGLFKWVSSLHQVAKVLEFQLQHQSFQWIFRTDFL